MIAAAPMEPVVGENAQSVPLHTTQLPLTIVPFLLKLSGSSSQRVSSLKEGSSSRGQGEGVDDRPILGRRPSSQRSFDAARSPTESVLGERVTPVPQPPLLPFDALAQVGSW